ncbi:DUF6286 domain-containing protein [Arthrobacter caoxuetaonis]|uniref:DUF6286 domain-containing protein n=1 Tax=Arthrobacter caoxuetaonis TaxID=2886935 RepID=A0A9X1SCK8_9MICC|nr:DUF6286 domain-containing protein [Arthrobacter caoxuetaonis]MCC3281626.1 DUF6286 domain-containing protein [Arthrobacter caoxuetaonis]MCC3298705.1 DUF6286 domain-containing protein [Arthrobacter caoxuetaonis]USQ57439.1 DUF6286 domain-containing protein [Arthrobacter caoxuetaonis]
MSHLADAGPNTLSSAPSDAAAKRIVRRETHAARTVPAVIAAVLGILLCLYVLLESVLQSLGQEEWLIDPPTFAHWLAGLPRDSDPLILGLAGALIFLCGLWFFLMAVMPGRRARYSIPNPRAAVVVDAEVLAASLARRSRLAAGVAAGQVLVTVGRTRVEVRIRPTSGIPVDADTVRSAVEDELALTGLDPQPSVQVQVSTMGAIGQ